MDPLRIIAEQEGCFLRREALDCGYTDKSLQAARIGGAIVRVRHGAYTFQDLWEPLTAEERHLVHVKAVLRTTPGPVAVSHASALVAYGVSLWGVDLSHVHVTRLDKGAGRVERDVVHHVGRCPEDDVQDHKGIPVVRPERALLEAGSRMGLESALVAADSTLHLGLADPDELQTLFGQLSKWPGIQKLHVVLRMMDGRAESPGESRSRYLFWRHGVPAPELQFKIYDQNGVLIAVVDFAWPEHGVFGEFDGKVKYGRLLKPGQQPGDVVFAEKQREDEIRELTGWRCGRIIWVNLDQHPQTTAHRFTKLLRIPG